MRAAKTLFYENGYDGVGMSDIAEAVGIAPSALYRHFNGKQQLMTAAVREGIRPLIQLLAETDICDRDLVVGAIVSMALDEREAGVLWQRESRHLSPEDQVTLRADVLTVGRRMRDFVQQTRAELDTAAADFLGWSLLSGLVSVSYHSVTMPRNEYERVLRSIVDAVLDVSLTYDFDARPSTPASTPGGSVVPASRREALLAAAVRMFAETGYSNVAMEEIGAAVGITGPSVYHYYPAKSDMLQTALNRGAEALRFLTADVYASATSATDALLELVRGYIRFATSHHHLVEVLISEIIQLPDVEREHSIHAQREFVEEWVNLLRLIDPDRSAPACRVAIHAALGVINDAARTRHLQGRASIVKHLETVSLAVLSV